jgi:hypothetical protein
MCFEVIILELVESFIFGFEWGQAIDCSKGTGYHFNAYRLPDTPPI